MVTYIPFISRIMTLEAYNKPIQITSKHFDVNLQKNFNIVKCLLQYLNKLRGLPSCTKYLKNINHSIIMKDTINMHKP